MNYNEQIKKTKADILESIKNEILKSGITELVFDENQPILHWCDGETSTTERLYRIGIFDGEMHFSASQGTTDQDLQVGYTTESLASLLECVRETIKNGRQNDINEIRSLVGNYGSFCEKNATRYGELCDLYLDDGNKYEVQFKVSHGYMNCKLSSLDDADIKRILEIVKDNHTGTYLINVEAKFSTQYEIKAKTADEAIAIAQGVFAGEHEDVNDEYEDLKFFT